MCADSRSSSSDTQQKTESLVRRFCSPHGEAALKFTLEMARQPDGLGQIYRTLGIARSGDPSTDLYRVSQWIYKNGAQAYLDAFRSKSGGAGNFQLKPLARPEVEEHDRRMMELMLKSAKRPGRNADTGGARANGGAPAPAPQPPLPAAPATKEAPPAPPPPPAKSRAAETAPAAPAAPPPAPTYNGPPLYEPPASLRLPEGGYAGPPGYPFPWPPHLKPGPVAPPPDLPPDQLTWPYVERRTGEERRTGVDRRGKVDLIYKNKRYGGDRRKTERRKNWPPRKKP